jgi:hypothetical protein
MPKLRFSMRSKVSRTWISPLPLRATKSRKVGLADSARRISSGLAKSAWT